MCKDFDNREPEGLKISMEVLGFLFHQFESTKTKFY